jgi:hypothetical protein
VRPADALSKPKDHGCQRSPGPKDQCVHELHALIYRAVIEQQGVYIRDLERRLAGEPVTVHWLDGLRQPQAPKRKEGR